MAIGEVNMEEKKVENIYWNEKRWRKNVDSLNHCITWDALGLPGSHFPLEFRV